MFSDQDKTERVTANSGGCQPDADAAMISGFGRFHTDKNGTRPYGRLAWSDILAMVDHPQEGVPKDNAQWLIPSTLSSRVHAEQERNGQFHALWADVDWKEVEHPRPMDDVVGFISDQLNGADFEVYASKSATVDKQKCRILIPIEPLSGCDWVMAQRVLNALLEEAGIPPDTASEGAGQLCYLPNRGTFYDVINQRGRYFFNPLVSWKDPIAAIRQEDQAQADAVAVEHEARQRHREALRAANVGQGGPSLIDAFNASYGVSEILLRSGYDQRGNTFRHPNSETGSFSASVKDGRVHSLSSADPLFTGGSGGGAHDAFSAFQVLVHGGDQCKALIEAGDAWLMIGPESWNTVRRRKYSKDRHQQQTEEQPEFGYDLDQIPPVEFGIDGFTSTGLTVIAAEAGAGKTSMAVPLAATVAHLLSGDPDDPFSLVPALRRKIIYVTEDAGQVQRLLYGLRRHRSQASRDEFREWFHIKEARRKSPTEIAADIRKWRDQYRYQAGPKLNNFMIEPLVVLDTSNATIDIENENDNAQVGRAISAIKQALEGRGMVWIIAHIAKGVSRTEIASMTVRGASAWVGDVNATAYLVTDEHVKDKRFLVLGKRRFEPDFTELEVTSETFSIHVQTPWGRGQVTRYMVCDLRGLARKDSMAAQAAKARSEKYAQAIVRILEEQYEIQSKTSEWIGLTTKFILDRIDGKTDNKRAAIKEMVRTGKLESQTDGEHATATTYYWLRGQTLSRQQETTKGRSRREDTEKTAPKDEPSSGGENAEIASPPYSTPPCLRVLEKRGQAGAKPGRSRGEGAKLNESEAEQPDSMADFDSWVGPESMPGYSSDGILRDGSRVVI
jgi:AAA domain